MKSELERLCDRERVRIECVYGAVELPEEWTDRAAHPYKVTLRYQRRQITTPFFCGSGWEREPNAADVLGSLILDASLGEYSFEDFCSEMGYDEDSRRAERTWKACAAMAPRLHRFLGDSFDDFANAEH